jgi:sec-independent protein translocase protein TatC
MGKRARKLPKKQRLAKASASTPEKLPLIEHLHELRRRLLVVAACVAAGSAIAYAFEHQIVAVLLRPSHGQQFIYTSPIGGMNFLFSVCIDIGLIMATPVIIYQLLAFLHPIMKDTTRRFLLFASAAAGAVALAGVVFGYFVGLPSALNFLLHQFTTVQVRPLITIQSYMQFVALYLFGSALMFQLPLILFITNRIKPLKPGGLFKYERHLIIGAFVVAFIMNPTPNIIDQLLVVVPIIFMYQVGIAMIWLVNRDRKPDLIQTLREQDAQRRAERLGRDLKPMKVAVAPAKPLPLTPVPDPIDIPKSMLEAKPSQPHVLRLRGLVQ